MKKFAILASATFVLLLAGCDGSGGDGFGSSLYLPPVATPQVSTYPSLSPVTPTIGISSNVSNMCASSTNADVQKLCRLVGTLQLTETFNLNGTKLSSFITFKSYPVQASNGAYNIIGGQFGLDGNTMCELGKDVSGFSSYDYICHTKYSDGAVESQALIMNASDTVSGKGSYVPAGSSLNWYSELYSNSYYTVSGYHTSSYTRQLMDDKNLELSKNYEDMLALQKSQTSTK